MKIRKLLAVCAIVASAVACKKENEPELTKGDPAAVTTIEASSVLSSEFTAGGNVTADGGSEVTERGICYGTEANVTVESGKLAGGKGKGAYEVTVTGLEFGTKYYYKAYAVNSAGVAYGKEYSLTTTTPQPAVVVTAEVTNAAGESATCGGEITDDGNSAITACGVCWAKTENPTIENSKTTDTVVDGEFVSVMTGLEVGETYYVRAYATNDYGTVYGAQKSFATIQPKMPVVTTVAPHTLTETGAASGGNITDNGGVAITARGVCWATHKEPTVDDNKTVDGEGSGEFESEVTGLTEGTVYYLRAYATNSVGTAYGEEKVFAPFYLDNGEEMALIPGGTFVVGKDAVHTDAGSNTWTCTLPDYYIAKTEVTQVLWREIMGEAYLADQLSDAQKPDGYICYPVGKDDYNPQPYINWFDAIIFANKLSAARSADPCYYMEIDGQKVTNPDNWNKTGEWEKNIKCDFTKNGFRLPTLPEWEFAAGGGAEPLQTYPGTDNFSELGLYGQIEGHLPGGATEGLFTVATKLPNKLGLYDMAGNATEWVWELLFEYPTGERTYYTDVISYNYGNRRAVKRGGTIWNWNSQVYYTTSNWHDGIDEHNWPCGMRLARTCVK